MDVNSDVWSDLGKDDYLCQFLREENLNNVEDQEFKLTTSEQLRRLTVGVNKLEDQLVKNVDLHYNDFISLGESIDVLQLTSSNLKSTGQELSSTVNNLNGLLLEPLNMIEKNKEILTRIYNTSEILICITRTQQVAKQLLLTQCSSEKALLIAELEENNDNIDLSGIDFIEKELILIESEKTKIKTETRRSLINALKENNYTEVQKNIKTLANLRVLQNELSQQLEDSLSYIEERIQSILNIQSLTSSGNTDIKTKITGPGRITGSTFPQVNVATFRTRLWTGWSEILNNILYPKCVQMFLLQAVTHAFKDALDHKISNIASLFWSESWEIMARFLIKLYRESTFVKQTLEAEYPKLLRLHSELYNKLHHLVFSSPYIRWISGNPFPSINMFSDQFENAYLSFSVSRLLDNIEGMFSHNSRPTHENVDGFIRTATNELNISLVDENLCITIARNIDKAIRLFCIKSDQLISFDELHDRIFESPSVEQRTNIEVTNTVHYLKQQVQKQLLNTPGNLPEDCKNQILKSLEHLDDITEKNITQISTAISGAIESIIIKIHSENFSSEDNGTSILTSSYIDELKEFIAKSYREYLCLFNDKKYVKKCCLKIATRTINFFLRHVCIIRPLGTVGRQKLAANFLQIESAIAPLCSNLNMLGESYEILKAFRPLLSCVDGKEVVNSKGNIPNSLVLLYLFSYGPENLLSPHQNCKWSAITFSNWLDNHPSDADALELISSTLQNYERIIKKENGNIHYIYNLMINLIEQSNQC